MQRNEYAETREIQNNISLKFIYVPDILKYNAKMLYKCNLSGKQEVFNLVSEYHKDEIRSEIHILNIMGETEHHFMKYKQHNLYRNEFKV